jgi:hypothetical protein
MKRFIAREDSAGSSTHTSGVHEAPTQPAPYLDEPAPVTAELLGSIPLADVSVLFQPVVAFATG